MKVIEDAWNAGSLEGGCVLTVGKFDGIHRGQQSILDGIRQRARALGVDAAVVTFEPHPREVLQPTSDLQLLTTAAQKRELLAAAGVDVLLVIRFDSAFAGTTAIAFCEDFLIGRLAAKEIHVGEAFQFGRGRQGNLESLQEIGRALGVTVAGVAEVMQEGSAVSSTRIRQALRGGDVVSAASMLGRAYSMTGKIATGAGRGRRIGWPTVNVDPENELIPADGVYSTWLRLGWPGREFEAVTNVGTRPTFDDECGRIVESHILDFDGETGTEEVELTFLQRLREERKFPSAEALSEQIARDVEAAREYFERASCLHSQSPGGAEPGV